jgi:4-hydroxy-tetrahydrodipicolinate reductase
MIPVIVNGITGRMGRRVAALAADPAGGLTVLAGITRRGDHMVGQSLGAVPVVDSFEKAACFATAGSGGSGRVVLIDFTTPEALAAILGLAADAGLAVVSGTTGLTKSHDLELANAAERIPVVWAANMSVGVHLLGRLVRIVAGALREADVEIVETHHRHKVDAPSGTAKRLAEIVRESRGAGAVVSAGRRGDVPGGRPAGEIGVQSVRMGEVVGEHEVHFALDHEIVTLSHRAVSRDVFAAGALAAGKFASGAAPGLYGMDAVLGISRSDQ